MFLKKNKKEEIDRNWERTNARSWSLIRNFPSIKCISNAVYSYYTLIFVSQDGMRQTDKTYVSLVHNADREFCT